MAKVKFKNRSDVINSADVEPGMLFRGNRTDSLYITVKAYGEYRMVEVSSGEMLDGCDLNNESIFDVERDYNVTYLLDATIVVE